MDEKELLRAIYRSIDWRRLYELAPRARREAVDRFFVRLRDLLEESPGPPAGDGQDEDVQDRLENLTLYLDGASSGNPGPAAAGMVLLDTSGKEVAAWGKYVGKATNNVAEYEALVAGVKKALDLGARRLEIFSDSQLVTRQMQGRYQVKSPALRPRYEEARQLLDRLEGWRIQHVPREKNRRADRLAREVVEKHRRRQESN